MRIGEDRPESAVMLTGIHTQLLAGCEAKHRGMDIVDKERRSQLMALVRSKDTAPEWTVRRLIFAAGYRYRLHVKTLPGKPDIVFSKRKKIILVNGCFWHYHAHCKKGRVPKTRIEYWELKLKENRHRDERNLKILKLAGWDVLTVWECELANSEALAERLYEFLGVPCS